MVLEVQADTWEVDDGLDASLLQLLGIADTRSLKDQWRGKGAARYDDLLAGTESARLLLLGGTRINTVGQGNS